MVVLPVVAQASWKVWDLLAGPYISNHQDCSSLPDPDYRQQMKREIESSNQVIYEDTDAVRELEQFFIQAVKRVGSRENNG